MAINLKAYLELIRFPNVFTAMADILAGYFIVSYGRIDLPTMGLLLVSSSSLYTGGNVLNDFFDYEIDKRENPGPRHIGQRENIPNISRIIDQGFSAILNPTFPPVTSSVQASILTGTYPESHGIVANGFLNRTTLETFFWEQSAYLVQRPQIWDILKRKDPSIKTAVLFWQNTLYANSDIIITPKPLHMESGMIQWCYSKPIGLYEGLTCNLGDFDLRSYWGPMASLRSSEWIMGTAIEILRKEPPHILFVYIPHLDYSSQKFGVMTDVEKNDMQEVDRLIGYLIHTVDELGLQDRTSFILLSEYSFVNVGGSVCLNRVLREYGLLSVREIQGKEYMDIEMSKAFAMVDHQMAHVYIKPGYVPVVKELMEKTEGVDQVWGEDEKRGNRINHERSGELVAIARPDKWFAYYWWDDIEKAPEFTKTVDIHRKPGYDPLELFFDPKIRAISTDMNLIKGSHGILPQNDFQKACLIIGGNLPDKIERKKEYQTVEIASIIEKLGAGDGI